MARLAIRNAVCFYRALESGRTPLEFDALFQFALPLPLTFAKPVELTLTEAAPGSFLHILTVDAWYLLYAIL